MLLGREHSTRRVATTIVLAYSLPFPAFDGLMRRYGSVDAGAWQACGATLALVAGEGAAFEGYTFNELQTLFRSRLFLAGGSTSLTVGAPGCMDPALVMQAQMLQKESGWRSACPSTVRRHHVQEVAAGLCGAWCGNGQLCMGSFAA